MTLLLAAVAVLASAAAPNGSGIYYSAADGKTGAQLKTALCGIIYSRTEKSYDYLWTAFQTTDKRSDGKVWDMYSSITNFTFGTDQAGNYQKEGDVYNREHSFPKSWFGGEVMPMYSDLHHMYPTDGYVNNQRGNLPFGEVSNPTYSSSGGFSKVGPCSYSDYTGKVFEPADAYKGDFARTYFYMVTCYEEKLADWYAGNADGVRATIDGTKYPAFQSWQLNMLLKWAKNDPVSQKEINRNNAVYGIQNNRNPFIDYPGLEQYIWGNKQNDAFSYNNYVQPDGSSSGSGGDPDPGTNPGGSGTYKLTITLSDFVTGGYAANNGEKTSQAVCTTDATKIYEVKWTSNQVANQDGNIQWQKNTGYIYNSTDLGTITSVTVTSSAGTFTTYYGTSEQPSSSTTVGGGYFKIVVGNATGISSKIEVVFSIGGNDPVDPTFNGLSNVSVNWGETLTLTQGTTGTPNFLTDGTVTLSSLNEDVVTINGLTITARAVGTAMITVSTAATTDYNAGSVMFPITVNAPEGKTTAAPRTTTVFTETFKSSTGTFGWSGTAATGKVSYDNSGWVDYYSYGGGGCVKYGKSDGQGRATTPALGTAGDLILTFKSGAWNGDKTTGGLVLSVEAGGGTLSTTTFDLSNAKWSTYSTTITGATEATKIKFSAAQSSKNRFFLDDVVVTKPGITLSATLNGSGYATFYSEYPLDFTNYETADYSAWQITGVSGETITFSQITGTVKGGTGILLKGEANADVTLTSSASSTTLDDNLHVGTLAPTYVAGGDYYGLSGNEFVRVNAGTVNAGKALLPASAVGGDEVKNFVFVFEDEETGIKDLKDSKDFRDSKVIYNLAGQMVNGKLPKGIYIVNGKKVLKVGSIN